MHAYTCTCTGYHDRRQYLTCIHKLAVRHDACISDATTLHYQGLAQTCNHDVMQFPMKPHFYVVEEPILVRLIRQVAHDQRKFQKLDHRGMKPALYLCQMRDVVLCLGPSGLGKIGNFVSSR